MSDNAEANLRNSAKFTRGTESTSQDINTRTAMIDATESSVARRKTNPNSEQHKLIIAVSWTSRLVNVLSGRDGIGPAAMSRLRALGDATGPMSATVTRSVAGNPRYLQPLIERGLVGRSALGAYPTYWITDLGRLVLNGSDTRPIADLVQRLDALNGSEQERLGLMMQRLGGYEELRPGPANLVAGIAESYKLERRMVHSIESDGKVVVGATESGVLSELCFSERLIKEEIRVRTGGIRYPSEAEMNLRAAGFVHRVPPPQGSRAQHALSLTDSGRLSAQRLHEMVDWLNDRGGRETASSLLVPGKTLPESLAAAGASPIEVSGIQDAINEFPYPADLITRLGSDATECSGLLDKLVVRAG